MMFSIVLPSNAIPHILVLSSRTRILIPSIGYTSLAARATPESPDTTQHSRQIDLLLRSQKLPFVSCFHSLGGSLDFVLLIPV